MEQLNQKFEKFIKKEVDNFEVIPSDKVWNRLSNSLSQNAATTPKKSKWILLAAAILAGIILVGLLFLWLKEDPKLPTYPIPVYANNFQSTDVFQLQQIEDAVNLMEQGNKKLVLVNCQINSCAECTKMQSVTYANAEIAAFVQKYFVKIDVEFKYDEITQLQDIYGLKSYPTALFLDRDGVLLDKVVGFQSPVDFLETLDNMMELEAMGQLVVSGEW